MSFPPRRAFDWHLRTRTLALGARTLIMAIVNLTPDSFSGDGLTLADAGAQAAIDAADAGADIIDLGAESTRPNAQPLTAAEEQARLVPVIEALLRARPETLVSVDTYHAETARIAAAAGAEIINDVSGLLWDKAMAEAAQATRCGLVLMHTRGRPREWHSLPPLAPAEVLPTVIAGLQQQLAYAQAAGIASERIVIDPGFGFGKLGEDNLTLLAGLDRLTSLGRPILAGLSRKGFLGKAVSVLQAQPLDLAQARLAATTAANVAAVLQGAHILRVHDIQPAREAARIADALLLSTP